MKTADHDALPAPDGSSAGKGDIGLVAAINQAGQAVVITDPQGSIVYVNAAFTAMTGYSSEEVIGRNPSVLKSEQQDRAYYTDLWETITAGRTWHGDLINRRKDGSLYTEEMTIAPVLDSNGNIVRYVALKWDVTERRASDDAQRFLAAIVASSTDAIFSVTLANTISSWNEGAQAIFGYSADEILGKPISLLLPPDRYDEPSRIMESIQAGGNLPHFETVRVTKDGHHIEVSLTLSPIRDARGNVVGTAAILRDISERRRADQAMREIGERFQALFNRSLDCIYIHDFDGNFLDLNAAALQLLGYEREELAHLNLASVLSEDQVLKALEKLTELSRTGAQKEIVEYRVKCKNGSFVDLETKAALIPSDGATHAILGVARDVTERRQNEQARQFQHSLIRAILEASPDGILVVSAEGRIVAHNQKFLDVWRIPLPGIPDDLPDYAVDGRPPLILSAAIDRVKDPAAFLARIERLNADPDANDHCEIALKDGRVLERYSTSLRADPGRHRGRVWFFRDITERKQAEEAVRASEEKFRQLAENIREVFWMMNGAGTEILYVSPAYEQIWGRTMESLYRNPMAWLEAILPEDREQAHTAFLRQMGGEEVESEYRISTPSGLVRWVRDKAFPVCDQAGEIVRVVGIAEDISARKKAEADLAHQARHDHLTGLANRTLLSDRLGASIERSGTSGLMTAVIYVDLDGFKFVNDSLGHDTGDALLQQVTERLRRGVRELDTLARMGGDEFMLVLNEVADDQTVLTIAERLRTEVRKPFSLSGREVYVTASMGIAMYPRDGTDVSTLRCNADTAMYEAKRGGKDRVLFFRPAMRATFLERVELDAELRRALERDQLSLVYQPIFDVEGGAQTAFEALLRWEHPVLGTISPAKFVPVAEETGLIAPLGAWVLEKACRECRRWQENGLAGVRVAVNVSAMEFALPKFTNNVVATLDKTGLSGHLLDLEVTETTLMRDMADSIQRMERLRERGVRISIDDFGTGYSSLGYLPRLPVDMLKIDRSFVAKLGKSDTALSLIQGMISLAHSIGKRVVVEGVETSEQLEIVRVLGADEVQGYLLGPPAQLPDWTVDQANAGFEEASPVILAL